MYIEFLLIVVGFFLLIKGADLLVTGTSNIAKRFNIPEIIIGLTIVSIGTSVPELFVSLKSALNGYSDMALGNVIGSNITNLLLILGTAAIIRPIEFNRQARLIELPLCLIITIIFALMCNIGTGISRIDAIVLVFILLAYIVYLSIMAIKGNEFDHEGGPFKFSFRSIHKNFDKKVFKDILFTVIGILGLKFGGDFVVNNAVSVAEYFKLSEKIISITILAVGTSLPELVTSVSAAIKGKSDIAIGNIIGSNIFNILLIIGMSSLISPIIFNISYNIDLIILTIAMLFLALFPYLPPKNEVSRSNGIAYVIMYVLYLVSIFIW